MTIDSVKNMKEALCEKLKVSFGSTVEEASDEQMLRASALVLRDVMAERGVDSARRSREEHKRKVHYLSMEFLMGRSLMKNAFNLGLGEILSEALDELGFRASVIFESSMRRSAWTVAATTAERVSLSPMPNSAVEIVSFSLMIGSAPSSRRRASVLWKFSRRLPPSSMSGAVMRSCATV